jgi:hypothetical protein
MRRPPRPERTPLSRRPLVSALLALALAGPGPALAAGEPAWAPADRATITPGVRTHTAGGQCTSNFVFYDDRDVYIGQAAHCATTGGPRDVDGCEAGSRPLGTPVRVEGASRPGRLAYSSWLAMRSAKEDDANACRFNDFALVRLDRADRASVNPSIPLYGGPTGLSADGPRDGEAIYSYGNSSLLGGVDLLNAKRGVALGTAGGGWLHTVVTVIPGVPGDSGSGYVDSAGRAFGVIRTFGPGPLLGSNGVTDLGKALRYLAEHSDLDVALAAGTTAFTDHPAERVPDPEAADPAALPPRAALLSRILDWLIGLLRPEGTGRG